MKYLFLLAFIPVLSFAQPSAKEFQLKGNLKLTRAVDWVYLRYRPADETIVDSVQPVNGSFLFKGTLTEPVMANLVVKYVKQPGDTRSSEFLPVFLEAGKMTLAASDSLKNNTVTGSKAHQEYLKLVALEKPYSDKEDVLY